MFRRMLNISLLALSLSMAGVVVVPKPAQAFSVFDYASCMVFNLPTFITYNYTGSEASSECA